MPTRGRKEEFRYCRKYKRNFRKKLSRIRKFIFLLGKQGLQHGRLLCPPKEYFISKEKGIQELDLGTGNTDIREPESIKEKREIRLGKANSPIEKKRKQSQILYRLFFVLLFVVVSLFLGVIYLNNRMSQREIEPSQILETAGEKPESNDMSVIHKTEPEGKIKNKPNGIREIEKKDRVTEFQPPNKPEAGSPRQVENQKSQDGDEEKPAKSRPFPSSVSMKNIAPDLVAEYNLKMKTLRVDLPRKVKVSGYFHVSLFMDDKGRVSFFRFRDSDTVIQPESKRDRVVLRIKQMIGGLQFRPPKDQIGQSVGVENWELKYQVTQFKQRMILRMR